MSEKKVSKSDGGHTSVSNIPEEFITSKRAAIRAVSQEPSEGEGGNSEKPSSDGRERIAPQKRSIVESQFTAPDTSGLPDIGEASFGPLQEVKLRTVHGPDDRVQINNTAAFPWRVHASLLITAADNSQYVGTGWFIGPHTLVTAGHVVCIKGSGVSGRDGWVKSISVMPGRNGNSLPYGAVTSTNFRSVNSWINDGNQNYDYGAIILPTDLGNTTGWFGFGVYSDSDLLATTANISGYPADKLDKLDGTQWYDHQKIANVNSLKVYYDIDTYGGQSGSAAYRVINGKRYGVAIHAYGGGTTNSGTRIGTDVYNNLKAWKA